MERLRVELIFSVEKAPDAGADDVSGRIGFNADNALSLSTKMNVKEGCSRPPKHKGCIQDRYEFQLCFNKDWVDPTN
jgi:hypothetical protein